MHDVLVEHETFFDMLERVRLQTMEQLAKRGIPTEYIEALMTALVEDGSVGYSPLQVEALYNGGVTPEYANTMLRAVEHYTALQTVELFQLGISAEYAIAGLLLDMSVEDIAAHSRVGIAPEYLADLVMSPDAC